MRRIAAGLAASALAAARALGTAATAVEAGCDILLMLEDLEAARRGLLDAVSNGTVSEERVNYPPLIPDEELKRGLPASSTAGSLSRPDHGIGQFSRLISAGVSSGGPRPTL